MEPDRFHEHALTKQIIRDIDGSVVWHYVECTCGWETRCERKPEVAEAAALQHANALNGGT